MVAEAVAPEVLTVRAPAGAARLLAGETQVLLLPQRAAWLPVQRALLVADVHLGKAAAFRALGVPVPEATTAATLARLDALVDSMRPLALCVLGDLLHSPAAQAPTVIDALAAWRARHGNLRVVLVRGNHDDRAGDPPAHCRIEVVEEPWRFAGLELRHEPDPNLLTERLVTGIAPEGEIAEPVHSISGHLHPVIRLRGRADALRLPCFWTRGRCTVLPAFGEFTGGWPISPAAGDRVFVTDGERVCEVPRVARRGRGATR
jgi:DNA ligase-associated metallophosphoesterase